MVEGLLLHNQEDWESDMILLDDAFGPFLPFSIDSQQEDGKLVSLSYAAFLQ